MRDNNDGKCSGVTEMVSGMVATSLRGGTKGACTHVTTPTLKSVMELINSVKKVL